MPALPSAARDVASMSICEKLGNRLMTDQLRKFAVTLTVGITLAVSACSNEDPSDLGLTDGNKLRTCPDSPNCVCSDQADSAWAIEPLRLTAKPADAWRALVSYATTEPRMRIVERREDYLRIESRTRLLRFVDDVEFHLRPDEQIIAMRSASRIGYSDLGTNRKRLESVRAALASTGAVRPSE